MLSLLLAAAIAPATAPAEPTPPPLPPRVALALSGGGARGVAHIGALRALEEAGIAVDAIAATSMGAIVGAIYATGRSPDELERIVRSLDWRSIFDGRPDRRTLPLARRLDRYASAAGVDFGWRRARLPRGLLAEHGVNRFLIEYLSPPAYAAGWDFDRLPIRFRCVAADLADAERLVIQRGDLARAVRASMSIPVAFPPVRWGDRQLIDGGVVDNLPVGVARELGARFVIAVDVARPPLAPEEYEDALGITSQITQILTDRSNADYWREPDVLVSPALGRHGSMDYSDLEPMIEAGYQAMLAAIPEIRARLIQAGLPERLEARPAPLPLRQLDGTPIAEVQVRGNRDSSEGLVRRTFNIPLGPPFSTEKSLRAFDKIEATGLFEHVWMEFEEAPAGLRVALRVEEAAPNRLELGVAFDDWEKARGSLRLRNLNSLGFGEETQLLLAASEAETVIQLSLRGERLLLPGLGYRLTARSSRDKPRFFDDQDGERINRGIFDRRDLDLRFEVGLERWGLLEAGLTLGRVETQPAAGLQFEAGVDQVRRLHAGVAVDLLDQLQWPRFGERLALHLERSSPGLGATRDNWRARAETGLARGVGERGVLQLDALAGLSWGELPVYDHFRLGTPLIPGLHREELKGPQALAAALSVRVRTIGQLQLFARGGAGNVYPEREAIRLADLRWGVGAGALFPTGLGPLALEIGVSDRGDRLLTLSVGWN